MTDLRIPASQYDLADEETLTAAGKRQILADWQRFISHGFQELYFTRELYRFLQQCALPAHTDRATFWRYYFDAEALRLRLLFSQFASRYRRSAEYETTAWLGGPAADLKEAMCQEAARLYAPLIQVLDDLEYKHAELGRAWREFALQAGLPDPGYPGQYVVSQNTRHLLAYAAHIALHRPQPPGLQRQFPLPFPTEEPLRAAA